MKQAMQPSVSECFSCRVVVSGLMMRCAFFRVIFRDAQHDLRPWPTGFYAGFGLMRRNWQRTTSLTEGGMAFIKIGQGM